MIIPGSLKGASSVSYNQVTGGITSPTNLGVFIISGSNAICIPTNISGGSWGIVIHMNGDAILQSATNYANSVTNASIVRQSELTTASNILRNFAAGMQSGSFTLSNLIAMGITNIVAGTNAVIYTNNGTLVINGTGSGGGSQTPWASDINGAGYNLTNAGIKFGQTGYPADIVFNWNAGAEALYVYNNGDGFGSGGNFLTFSMVDAGGTLTLGDSGVTTFIGGTVSVSGDLYVNNIYPGGLADDIGLTGQRFKVIYGSNFISYVSYMPTNQAPFYISTNPIVSGKFWTNTTGQRIRLKVNYTLTDSTVSGAPSLCMTNIVSGEFYNATNSFVLTGLSSGRTQFDMSPNDYFIATNKSSGSASASVDASFVVKE